MKRGGGWKGEDGKGRRMEREEWRRDVGWGRGLGEEVGRKRNRDGEGGRGKAERGGRDEGGRRREEGMGERKGGERGKERRRKGRGRKQSRRKVALGLDLINSYQKHKPSAGASLNVALRATSRLV